jgi:hypothetical protein
MSSITGRAKMPNTTSIGRGIQLEIKNTLLVITNKVFAPLVMAIASFLYV